MQKVELRYSRRPGWLALRELTGAVEETVTASDTLAAVALIDALLIAHPDAAFGPGEACELTAPDRDRVLAEIYVQTFGREISAVEVCSACGRKFDLDFDMTELLASMELNGEHAGKPGENATACVRLSAEGWFVTDNGARFRLPTAADELSAASEKELLHKCVAELGNSEPEALLEAMVAAAPLLALDLTASCPECGAAHETRFDLQNYLLFALRAERDQRAAEIHRIAAHYGWSLEEILSLSRQRRRCFAALIEHEVAL